MAYDLNLEPFILKALGGKVERHEFVNNWYLEITRKKANNSILNMICFHQCEDGVASVGRAVKFTGMQFLRLRLRKRVKREDFADVREVCNRCGEPAPKQMLAMYKLLLMGKKL